MSVLVLWDVDHTLVENAGVSKETYAAAFRSLAGVAPPAAVRTDGRTDRRIMRDLFESSGLPTPPWPEVEVALADAGAAHLEAMRSRGAALPGASSALAALAEVPNVVQSLLTGNIEPNARMKLTAVGLADVLDFSVGAYGDDSDDRAALVGLAQRRASQRYGRTFGPQNTLLIGDTPRDVDAGLRGGAHVLAVATGIDSVEVLQEAGGLLVLPDLCDTGRVVAEVTRLARDA